MIKSIGFGRKRIGMSHDESCRYHREVHAPMAKRTLGARGLKKYVGYYVDKAFTLSGDALPELPWDRVVLEWLTDELWKEMWTWRKTDPEGMMLAEDEKRYGDGKTGMMLLYKENVIVSSEDDRTGVNVIVLAAKRSDLSREEFVKYHSEKHAPMVARMLGSRLKKYIANYVYEGLSLADGIMPAPPYDVIAITQFDEEGWKGMDAWRKTPDGVKLKEDEERLIDRNLAIVLICQKYAYIL